MKLFIALMFVAFSVHAQHIDLTKGGVEKSPWMPCTEEKTGKQLLCVIVEHEKKQYIVLHDEKGEYKIFVMEGEKAKLLWTRGDIST